MTLVLAARMAPARGASAPTCMEHISMIRVRSLSVLGILAIAACAEPTLPAFHPTLVAGDYAAASSKADEASGTYLVRFQGDIPTDFQSSVAEMGGQVIWTHA